MTVRTAEEEQRHLKNLLQLKIYMYIFYCEKKILHSVNNSSLEFFSKKKGKTYELGIMTITMSSSTQRRAAST